jgi:hypothetical protein
MAPTKKTLQTPSKNTAATSKSPASKGTPSSSSKKSPVKTAAPKQSTDRVDKPCSSTLKQSSAKKVTAVAKAINGPEPTKPAQRKKTSKSSDSTERAEREPSIVSEVTIDEALPRLAQGPETFLHRLPGELRNRIYRYIGIRGSRIQLAGQKEPALATAIPDLRNEIHSIYFAENALQVSIYSEFKVHDSEPQNYRVTPRGGRFGAGKLAIDDDSWIKQTNADVVTIRRICLSVHEMGGYPIADFFVNVRRNKETGGQIVRGALHVRGTTKKLTGKAIKPMGDCAKHVAKKLGERNGFFGFSWREVGLIAASFHSNSTALNILTIKERKELAKAKALAKNAGSPKK